MQMGLSQLVFTSCVKTYFLVVKGNKGRREKRFLNLCKIIRLLQLFKTIVEFFCGVKQKNVLRKSIFK
jgi:hypothetical protein